MRAAITHMREHHYTAALAQVRDARRAYAKKAKGSSAGGVGSRLPEMCWKVGTTGGGAAALALPRFLAPPLLRALPAPPRGCDFDLATCGACASQAAGGVST